MYAKGRRSKTEQEQVYGCAGKAVILSELLYGLDDLISLFHLYFLCFTYP